MHSMVPRPGHREEELIVNKWNGYTGKVLDIDLGRETINIESLDEELVKGYMGGKGFGAKILFDQLPPQCPPLSPENILVFAGGPLTGTFAPSSGRFEVCTKSPATGLWLDSNCGGFFGPELKYAGYDMIIVRGKAEHPVLLVIDDDRVELKPALDMWGMDTFATHKLIKDRFGKDCCVSCIGPAGEKGVLFAGIISEYRALGRGGAGAVMGSKNLKAIAVKGSKGISIHDSDRFMVISREAFNEIANNPDTGGGRPKYGTNVILSCMDEVGVHPVRNFQKGKFDGASLVNEESIEKLFVRNKACFGCPIQCSKIAEIKDGKYKGCFTEGPEYENVWAFGANCENTDLGAIVQAEYLCDYYGLDSISTGNVIGFLMECTEKEIINESAPGSSAPGSSLPGSSLPGSPLSDSSLSDSSLLGSSPSESSLPGLNLKFGDDEAIIKAIHLIGKREGPGLLWGEGVRKIAEKLQGSEKLAMHVKGLELPGYDPRASTGMALAYATSDRGGCHLRSWPIGEELLNTNQRMDPFSTEFKSELVKNQQDLFCLINCSGMCLFATFALSLRQITPFLHAATGIEAFSSSEEVVKIGERVNNLVRLFNIREGLVKEMDTLPARFFKEPLKEGPAKDRIVELNELMQEYYLMRGWDSAGIPTDKKLRELDIEAANSFI